MIYKQLYQTTDFSEPNFRMNAEKNFDELKRIDSLQPEDSILFRYWKESYGDGNIFYQVVKVNKKTCIIQVCSGICLDEWDKGMYEVNIGYAKQMIKNRLDLEKLFSKK